MEYIIEPMILPDFIEAVDQLDPNKLFLVPADIYGHACRKCGYDDMVKTLEEMNSYWLERSDLITRYYIAIEYSDCYSIMMDNKDIRYFRPKGD